MNLRHLVTKSVQRYFWVYVTDNFVITPEVKMTAVAKLDCKLVSITQANSQRVLEFREDASRVREYGEKVVRGEIGYFAESNGKMVGSIWATVNTGSRPLIARRYMTLYPGEAMIHDIVTGDQYRGMGIAGFMVDGIHRALRDNYSVSKTIVDVNFRNTPSLRMMEKVGLRKADRVFYLSAMGTLLWSKVLRRYSC